ncbi:MAG TPA: CpsB/CapC family capsule biosynthesis tyrosine phosphatase [Gaiellaceae bacterium]|nr:CpsB/CapC family capsule biosynthesis tyrosine phosphatase [Gaiellaceae bacterium]
MIDSHCHLLAGLDDGPASLSESVRMARKLTQGGVSHVICTPHFSPQYPTDQRRAAEELVRLEGALEELKIELRLMLAAEVAPRAALDAPIEELQRRAIGRRFVVVELLRETSRARIDEILERLLSAELLPIFAHPERCLAVQTRPEILAGPRRQGALVQVVAPSLTGNASADVGRAAWGLISRGEADMVGSDGHRADSGRLRLDALAEVVARRSDPPTAARLFEDGPRRLIEAAAVSS